MPIILFYFITLFRFKTVFAESRRCDAPASASCLVRRGFSNMKTSLLPFTTRHTAASGYGYHFLEISTYVNNASNARCCLMTRDVFMQMFKISENISAPTFGTFMLRKIQPKLPTNLT
jgi:hypothetical protein